MDIGEDREKGRFKNWQLCGVWNWKLLFCRHRTIKLDQSCTCFAKSSIKLFVLPSVTREYHPKILKAFRSAAVYCRLNVPAFFQKRLWSSGCKKCKATPLRFLKTQEAQPSTDSTECWRNLFWITCALLANAWWAAALVHWLKSSICKHCKTWVFWQICHTSAQIFYG